jgi:hypothetical protein
MVIELKMQRKKSHLLFLRRYFKTPSPNVSLYIFAGMALAENSKDNFFAAL